MVMRSKTRERRVERARLTTAEEAQAMAEAFRAVEQQARGMTGDTVSDKVWIEGYNQALKDLAQQIGERRQFLKERHPMVTHGRRAA